MAEDRTLDTLLKCAIDGLVSAAEHIRDCERSRRVYSAAFEALLQERRYEPHPWRVLDQCTRELHAFERWP